jgi:hypothetical protein
MLCGSRDPAGPVGAVPHGLGDDVLVVAEWVITRWLLAVEDRGAVEDGDRSGVAEEAGPVADWEPGEVTGLDAAEVSGPDPPEVTARDPVKDVDCEALDCWPEVLPPAALVSWPVLAAVRSPADVLDARSPLPPAQPLSATVAITTRAKQPARASRFMANLFRANL